MPPLEKLRDKPIRIATDQPPWEQGYDLARCLRERLDTKDRRIDSVPRLGQALGANPSSWARATSARLKLPFADAMVATTRTGAPYFAVQRSNVHAKTFALCRAVGEYLAVPTDPAAIVTPTHSERQKRNRAFAAELIAPAQELRAYVKSPIVDAEEIQDLAAEFGTSEYVIKHQIENHRIARVADGWT